jgi:hydrogenase maturation protein HypF
LFAIHDAQMLELDFSPLVLEIVEQFGRGCPSEPLAAMFHEQLAWAWDAAAAIAADRTGIRCVALSGGVFCNQRFTESLQARLEQRGLRVLRHRLVPPNDGGLAYGQAAVAAARAGGR